MVPTSGHGAVLGVDLFRGWPPFWVRVTWKNMAESFVCSSDTWINLEPTRFSQNLEPTKKKTRGMPWNAQVLYLSVGRSPPSPVSPSDNASPQRAASCKAHQPSWSAQLTDAPKDKISSQRSKSWKITHWIHVWYVWLHLPSTSTKCIGKYTMHGSYGSWNKQGQDAGWLGVWRTLCAPYPTTVTRKNSTLAGDWE